MTTELSKIFMHTASGKKYFPFAPQASDVSIEVIAHHLATRARWAGATQHRYYPERIFYSVAEHSVYVANYVEKDLKRPDLALAALLHDGSEAYNGDLIRPLKYSDEFREPFKRVELLNEAAVEERFGVKVQMLDPAIKVADDAICFAEWRQIVPRDSSETEWTKEFDDTHSSDVHIEMLLPFAAKQLFLERYKEIIERMKMEVAA